MITVFKYAIKITDEQEIEMPSGATIIHVGPDPRGTFSIWAEVDTNKQMEKRKIYVTGTGNPIPKYYDIHVGSFIDGSFVWHVWCDKSKSMGVR